MERGLAKLGWLNQDYSKDLSEAYAYFVLVPEASNELLIAKYTLQDSATINSKDER